MISIIYNSKHIIIKGEYNPKLVKVMKLFQASYHSRTKVWSLPKYKANDLIEEFINQDIQYVELNKPEYTLKREVI